MRASLIRQAAVLLALAFVPAIGQAILFRDRVAEQQAKRIAQEVTLDQALAWGDATLWIDARAEAQYEREHIPGAVLLNEDRFNELLPQALANWTPQRKIVVYCSSEGCHASRQVAERIRKETRLPDVFVLAGGWEAWKGSK